MELPLLAVSSDLREGIHLSPSHFSFESSVVQHGVLLEPVLLIGDLFPLWQEALFMTFRPVRPSYSLTAILHALVTSHFATLNITGK